jgi:hypothetical protein
MGIQDRDWYWKERARKEGYRGPPPASAPGPVRVVLSLRRSASAPNAWMRAVGWAAAAVLVLVATILVAQWRDQVAAERASLRTRDSLERSTRAAAENERRIAAQQTLGRAELHRKEAVRVEALREQERGRQEAAALAAQQAARKVAAWETFYRRSSRCSDVATVECANEFIRARRAFESMYSPGQL